jgi:hypothetical protein
VTALAEYFDSQMATKQDIANLHVEIEKVRSDLSRDIEQLRSELGRDIAHLRSDVDLKIAGLDTKISETKADTIRWVAGLLIAQAAFVVALIKFLPGVGH